MTQLIPNQPTPEGIAIGAQMARLSDREIQKLIQSGECDKDQRCASCAFRLGTVPNGCLPTQLDAVKAVFERQAFHCHHVPKEMLGNVVCAGWFAAVQATKGTPPITVPWGYST